MKSGDRVTVWVGEHTKYGQLVRGHIVFFNTMKDDSARTFQDHMDERVKNGLSRLYEWETASSAVRLIDEKDRGITWLPGWSDEIDRAIRAARALM